MTTLNLNRLAVLVAVIIIIVIAAASGYSLEISLEGLYFSPTEA